MHTLKSLFFCLFLSFCALYASESDSTSVSSSSDSASRSTEMQFPDGTSLVKVARATKLPSAESIQRAEPLVTEAIDPFSDQVESNCCANFFVATYRLLTRCCN